MYARMNRRGSFKIGEPAHVKESIKCVLEKRTFLR